MAKIRTRQKVNNSQLGRKPTNSQKLIYVSDALGIPGIASMQGTTFNLYDTVILPTSNVRQTLNFFQTTSNKSKNFTNFQSGVLSAGEALVVEEVKFFLVNLTNTDLTSDANAFTSRFTFSSVTGAVGILTNPFALTFSNFSLSIANSQVIKEYQISETLPDMNPATSGVSNAEITAGAANTLAPEQAIHGNNIIRTEAPPVIPPNQKIQLSLNIPPVGTVTGSVAIMCVIGKFGSIYSAKTNL